MVMRAGLSKEMGPVEYGENRRRSFFRKICGKTTEHVRRNCKKVDKEIRKIVDKGYERAKKNFN